MPLFSHIRQKGARFVCTEILELGTPPFRTKSPWLYMRRSSVFSTSGPMLRNVTESLLRVVRRRLLSVLQRRRSNRAKCRSYESQPLAGVLRRLGPNHWVCFMRCLFPPSAEPRASTHFPSSARRAIRCYDRQLDTSDRGDGDSPFRSLGEPGACTRFRSRTRGTGCRYDPQPDIPASSDRRMGSAQDRCGASGSTHAGEHE